MEERGLSEESRGGRGIASGAKIRFARCRLHPRSIATHLPSGPPAPFEPPRARGTLPSLPLAWTVLPTLSRPLCPVPLAPVATASHPLSPSATVPRKLERAPPFDPADSHPPRPSAATHPSVDLTPSPMASIVVPTPPSRHPLPNPSFAHCLFFRHALRHFYPRASSRRSAPSRCVLVSFSLIRSLSFLLFSRSLPRPLSHAHLVARGHRLINMLPVGHAAADARAWPRGSELRSEFGIYSFIQD